MIPECRACGACCASLEEDAPELASLTNADVARLGRRMVRLHVLGDATRTVWKAQQAGPFKGASACVCSALAGSLLHRVRCLVYEKRPQVCREFLPGSSRCKEALQAAQDALEDLAEKP